MLAPVLLTDPNGNRAAAGYDGLGQLERTAVLGKVGDTDLDSLEEPTSLLEYDLWAWHDDEAPVWMRTQTRELHGADPGRTLEAYAYADGRGGTVMAKVMAQPGTEVYDEVLTEPVERWVGSGRTIRNNKGLPVRQYEPFFSTTSAFESEEELVEHGVTPVLHYDPLGRLVRTELPNGTQAHVEFTPWEQRSHDPNDDVLESSWYAERIGLSSGDPERRAAELAEAHAGTPTVTHLDHLGRAFLAVEHSRDALEDDVYHETRAQLDVQGNVLRITDANGTIAEERVHGMLGQVLQTTSLEVGDRWALVDVLGAPLYATASRGFSTRYRYDAARRATHTFVTRPDSSTFTATRIVYGEAAASPTASNLRGQVFRTYDGAGLHANEEFDVDGNLVRQSRCLAAAYDTTPDWSDLDELDDPADMDTATATLLESEVFTTEASFDAMGRPVTKTSPDASVLHLGYGDAGHLETVAANVRGDVTESSFVTDLRYNARGQRTLVVYGNGTQTSYAYDPQTFRLTQVQTLRVSDDHPHQDLRYTFDPVGNVVEIQDFAQPIVFTSNAAVSANQRFEYDGLYRLVHAEGREHESQGQPVSDDFTSRAAPEDPTGLRLYTEQYLYDLVGNILEQQHTASGGNWTRRYSYDTETSGNRLLATSAPGDGTGVYSHTYAYDAHGSMTAMPHLAAIGWDWADRMESADLGGGGTVYFTYDAAGQRVRKVRVNLAGTSTWERIYLGGFELYREHVSAELRLERQTLHVGDDAGRVCLVETKTIEDASPVATPASICRYQYGNHLGTVGLELDESGLLISYEEFHPYGTTAYRAANGSVEVSPSRYRYTGKERDEETGLGYHGARYYASWLGRWTAADPIGLGDGPNRFAYARGRPTVLSDPSGTQAGPIQDDIRQYESDAETHNTRVQTWHAQMAMFDAEAPNARQTARNLDHERRGLLRQEALLLNRLAILSNRVVVAQIEQRLQRAYEHGGPEFMNLSGRSRGRIDAAVKLSLGTTLVLSGGSGALLLGADFLQAGGRQMASGDNAETLLRSGTSLASEALGNSPQRARFHGDIAETIAPAVTGGWQMGTAATRPPSGLGSFGDAANLAFRPRVASSTAPAAEAGALNDARAGFLSVLSARATQQNHIVLGLRDGLRETARAVGGRHLLDDPAWRTTLRTAVADPNTRFTISLRGIATPENALEKLGEAITRGTLRRGASATDWEISLLNREGRLESATFLDEAGNVIKIF